MTTIELSRRIDVSAPALWSYISTAEGLSAWHADVVTGSLSSGVFVAKYPTLGAELPLKVESQAPGRMVALRAGQSQVTLSVERISAQASMARISHAGLEPSDDLDGFRSSWELALGLLELAATDHPGKSRSVIWCFERVPVAASLAHYYFSTAQGLSSWLGETDQDVGPVGSRFSIRLSRELTLTGQVLCHEPGRDVCFSWQELDNGALTLRTLPVGHSERQLALSYSSFVRKHAERPRSELKAAMKRLGERLRSVGVS